MLWVCIDAFVDSRSRKETAALNGLEGGVIREQGIGRVADGIWSVMY